jgi:hypothetical protein
MRVHALPHAVECVLAPGLLVLPELPWHVLWPKLPQLLLLCWPNMDANIYMCLTSVQLAAAGGSRGCDDCGGWRSHTVQGKGRLLPTARVSCALQQSVVACLTYG